MKLHFNWKKTLIVLVDIVLAGYLGFVMTSFNTPNESGKMCTKVSINIADENTNGFLSAKEIKKILETKKIYPLEQKMISINPRTIEETLKTSPFVSTAQCYKTKNGHVFINVTQRLPLVRIKSITGDDYYVDDLGGIMSSSKYTSDLIIATGYISKPFAQTCIATLTDIINNNEFWKNQVVQINVMPDQGIELIPRVGDHIIYLGILPQAKQAAEREKLISNDVLKKLDRLEKFYRYGLSQAGWNRYHYISLEFDNQIICKKNARVFPLPEVKRDTVATAKLPQKPDSTKVETNDEEVPPPAQAQVKPEEQPKEKAKEPTKAPEKPKKLPENNKKKV